MQVPVTDPQRFMQFIRLGMPRQCRVEGRTKIDRRTGPTGPQGDRPDAAPPPGSAANRASAGGNGGPCRADGSCQVAEVDRFFGLEISLWAFFFR